MHVERIHRTSLMESVLPSLKSFYFSAILPKLASPRHLQGPIHELQDWLENSSEFYDIGVELTVKFHLGQNHK